MGWLFYTDRRIRSYADEKAEITRLCTFENDERRNTLLKCSKVGSVWYAAVQSSRPDGKPLENRSFVTSEDGSFVFGGVFLIRYDDGCFGYKDMDETMGPAEARAPVSILDLRSDLKDPDCYAHDWRARCRAWAGIPTYDEGDTIRLANPVTLTDGSTCQIVQASHYMRGRRQMRCYRVVDSGVLVRLSKASLMGSELVEAAASHASPVLAEFFAGQGSG